MSMLSGTFAFGVFILTLKTPRNKKKMPKEIIAGFFYTYLIRIIMSNMEEHVLIQIFLSFNLCTTFYSLSNVKCNIKIHDNSSLHISMKVLDFHGIQTSK